MYVVVHAGPSTVRLANIKMGVENSGLKIDGLID